jgi:transketolase
VTKASLPIVAPHPVLIEGCCLGSAGRPPDAIIIARGSEVALAIQAYEDLAAEGVSVRVVSLPPWALFGEQDRAYRNLVLPPAVRIRVAVEQAATLGWERWTGDQGTIIGMHSFGASGPGPDVRRHFGFTAGAVTEAVRECLVRAGATRKLEIAAPRLRSYG